MIREATVNLTRKLYRPLDRAGQRSVHKPAAGSRRISRQPARYPVLDNARFLLISLVVTGHLLEQLADSGPITAALYRWIYLFHMPAFVLISGAVSKAALTRRRAFALVTGLLLPLVAALCHLPDAVSGVGRVAVPYRRLVAGLSHAVLAVVVSAEPRAGACCCRCSRA